MRAFWFDLNYETRSFLGVVIVITACAVVLMTANRLLFGNDPDIIYKCTNEQAVFVEKSITECLADHNSMSTCSIYARETFCSILKDNVKQN